MEYQLSFLKSLQDLLILRPLFFLGLLCVILLCLFLFRRHHQSPNIRILAGSVLLYYYMCIMLKHVTGVPMLRDWIWMTDLGESIFHPSLQLIPFGADLGFSFFLNIFLFIPFGFLCPMISRSYARLSRTVLTGIGLSLIIELLQLFTLYRATDINDIIANGLGAILGCLCYRLLSGFFFQKKYLLSQSPDPLIHFPVILFFLAFFFTFVS